MLARPFVLSGDSYRGKYALSEGATGPWAVWRPIEDAAAIVGNTLNLGGRQRMGVSRKFLGRGFQGITLEATEVPQTAALGVISRTPLPPGRSGRSLLGRFSCTRGACVQMTRGRVRPSFLRSLWRSARRMIGRNGKPSGDPLRRKSAHGLNGVLVNRDVKYGAMGGFLSLLALGCYVAVPYLQDCLLHWAAAPTLRRFLDVRRPACGLWPRAVARLERPMC